MKKTIKLSQLVEVLNNTETKFASYIDYSQQATDRSEKFRAF
ncbi:hypothetical protein [uncultured Parasutterella sp.]|nr:hypothetical protein [uncultured Parasutterella sp.]